MAARWPCRDLELLVLAQTCSPALLAVFLPLWNLASPLVPFPSAFLVSSSALLPQPLSGQKCGRWVQ